MVEVVGNKGMVGFRDLAQGCCHLPHKHKAPTEFDPWHQKINVESIGCTCGLGERGQAGFKCNDRPSILA